MAGEMPGPAHGIRLPGPGAKKERFADPALVEIAGAHGKTPVQTALRFLTQSGVIAIPRSARLTHIQENLDLFDFQLMADELERLAAMDAAAPMIGRPEDPSLVELAMTW